MTNVVLPFLLSILLGRTIDLRTYSISGAIYDYRNFEETSIHTMNTTYHVLQDDSFPYAEYGLPIDIVLRIKSDYLTASSGALNGLLKDIAWKFNSVVVAAVTVYNTVNRRLTDTATVPDWKHKTPLSQTHYTDSLYYGEWVAVLFKFKCDIPGDVHVVRKTLTDTLGVSGGLDKDTVDLWNKAVTAIQENEDIRGKVQVIPTAYSTFQLPEQISSVEDYVRLLDEIPKIVKNPGQPMYMSLKPLSEIDGDFNKIEQESDVTDELRKVDDMFDDLKITKENLFKWTSETDQLFSDEDEQRIYSLIEKINANIRSFLKVNDDVSLFKKMDRRMLELAFHQYLIGLERGMGTYNLAYLKLREEIDASCGNEFLHEIKGLLKVYDDEKVKKGEVKGGLEECQKYCLEDDRCRAVGYASHITQLDMSTGEYYREENQCWIYYRSTNTAIVYTPSEFSGEMGIYDRKCFLK